MAGPRRPLFLGRASYRGRRLADAARLVPVLGAFFFALPVLWQPAASQARDTAPDGLYLFGVWGLLILAAGLIAPRLSRKGEQEDEPGGAGD
jgi:hypothetical protein